MLLPHGAVFLFRVRVAVCLTWWPPASAAVLQNSFIAPAWTDGEHLLPQPSSGAMNVSSNIGCDTTMPKVRWCMVLAVWINGAPTARWTKTRYRLAVARDFVLALAAMFALLALFGFILYKLDSNRRLVRILTGAATDRFDVYLLGAMVGSLASVG